MTSTKNSKSEVLSNELKTLRQYLKIIGDERAEQLRISKSPFRSKLTRIHARKEVFRLDQEITAKQKYIAEIEENIRITG